MENINIKNLLLFSLSVTLLVACCAGTFYIWKSEKDNALNQKVQREKRLQMDEAYRAEFRSIYKLLHTCLEFPEVAVLFKAEDFEKNESKMRNDGYDFGEIQEIKKQASVEADEYFK